MHIRPLVILERDVKVKKCSLIYGAYKFLQCTMFHLENLAQWFTFEVKFGKERGNITVNFLPLVSLIG